MDRRMDYKPNLGSMKGDGLFRDSYENVVLRS